MAARRTGILLLLFSAAAAVPPWTLAASEAASSRLDALHAPFSELLARYVAHGRVDYPGLARERAQLDAYLTALESVDGATLQKASRSARIAYWINAYNALMLRLVLDAWPVRKVLDIPSGDAKSLFDRPLFHSKARGEVLSLDAIEHQILRKELKDPRIHFAIVCGARSCPPLRSEAYLGRELSRQLQDQIHHFLVLGQGARLQGGTLYLSKIFEWFAEDFGGDTRRWILPHLPPSLRKRALRARVAYAEYDWTVNAQKLPSAPSGKATSSQPPAP
ncbi:MAG: DUF547 domain-containing protein [Deltaproteobacteria bacterium]|nr:MAG: DUF547 domain-containing protein [Deltaproteobacteria bacterium]